MLFLKRFATSLVLFIILFVFLEMAAIIGVGVIVGSRVGENAADFRSAYAAGEAAGSEASGGYGRLTLLGAMGTAAVSSLATEFPGSLQGRTERTRSAIDVRRCPRRSATGVSPCRPPCASRTDVAIDQLPSLGTPSPPPAALAHRA